MSYDMDIFFRPKSVAIFGVSRNPHKEGNTILRNLLLNQDIRIYPINPFAPDVLGIKADPSLHDVKGPVDLAILFIPADRILQAVEDCAHKGVKGIIIESSGFNEVGNWELSSEIKEAAERAGIRVWGPNCTGFVDFHQRLFTTFAALGELLEGRDLEGVQGNVSILSQSGMMAGGMMFQIITGELLRLSKICSVGNKLDVDECDLLAYLAADPTTEVIGLYLEGFSHGRRFLELARSITPHKPMVLLTGGLSAGGAQAALSHTGSMIGGGDHLTGLLKQAGIICVEDFTELIAMLNVLSILKTFEVPIPTRANVAMMVGSGGIGVVLSDHLERQGNLKMATYSHKTRQVIAECFPEWMKTGQGNPCDYWPALENKGLGVVHQIKDAILDDANVDVLVVNTFAAQFGGNEFSQHAIFQHGVERFKKPIFAYLFGNYQQLDPGRLELNRMGIPVFLDIRACMEAVSKLCRYGQFLKTV